MDPLESQVEGKKEGKKSSGEKGKGTEGDKAVIIVSS